MKAKLTLEQVHNKMKWPEVMEYYFPGMPESDREYLLWNETCYPFDHAQTLEQLWSLYEECYKLAENG